VTLVDGSVVEVWADSVSGISEKTADDSHIVFGVLLEIEPDEQDHFEVIARTPASRRRVEVAVARFLRESVRNVQTI
jgi:hypothetical protein